MKYFRLIITFFAATILLASLAVQAAPRNDHAATKTSEHSVTTRHAKAEATEVVNINSADAQSLMTLKGIGAKKAQAIVAYRNQHGSFQSIDDLANVKGIGKSRLAAIIKNNPDAISVK